MNKVVFDDIHINIHDIDGLRAKCRLHKMTAGKLGDSIQGEVRGHARSFSRMEAWTGSIDKKDEEIGSIVTRDDDDDNEYSEHHIPSVLIENKISTIKET